MLRPRLVAFAVAGAAFAGCFVDTPQPPPFRFDCGSDGDCTGKERCVSGLCQVPCTFLDFEQDCPQTEGYATCFNGVCAHTCSTQEKDPCPGAQSCVPIATAPSGGEDLEDLGLCGELCEPGQADTCPEQEVCVEGLCVPVDGGDTGTEDTGGSGA